MADRIVTKVRPRRSLLSLPEMVLLKRVAAYARVSTGSDEQLNSIAAQKDYFEKLINKRPDWIFVGIYADEGISGISTKKREAFNRMVNDAMDGKIDLIVTKSLSRFARNTVDSLSVIRQLKSVNVGVYFEKEDINTLDSKGEFLITLMSSLAEEESRSISENITWGQRKRFADGRYSMPYKQFLGYKKGADGCPEIVEKEAETVKLIYRLCLEGYPASSIAKMLTSANIPTPAGMSTWPTRTIDSILRNEKYYGAALLQKSFTFDYRRKIIKPNRGELPMYYIENGHEGIVTKEVYDEVQKKLVKKHRSPGGDTCFPGKIYCSSCGGLYGPITFHSTTYNDTAWKCLNRHLHRYPCESPHLYEEMLKPIFHEIILTAVKANSDVVRSIISALEILRHGENTLNKKTIVKAVANYDINSKNEHRIWRTAVQKVIVQPGHLLEFYMINGCKVEYRMMKTAPRMPKPTKCAKEDIHNDYINGCRIDTLAKKYGFSIGTIKSILKQKNNKDLVIKEYKQGKKQSVIARELGIPFSTVRSIIYRARLTNTTAKKVACLNCGNEFECLENGRKYCCRECYFKHRYNKK